MFVLFGVIYSAAKFFLASVLKVENLTRDEQR